MTSSIQRFAGLAIIVFALSLLIAPALIATPASALQTEPPAPQAGIVEVVELALAAYIGLQFWTVLLTSIITALQFKGLLSLEGGERLNLYANIGLFGLILILTITGQIDIVSKMDVLFGNLSQLLTYLFILLGIPAAFVKTQERHAAALSYSALIRNSIR